MRKGKGVVERGGGGGDEEGGGRLGEFKGCSTCIYIYYIYNIQVLMRDEKEGKKQARSNKLQGKATQHTQDSHFS